MVAAYANPISVIGPEFCAPSHPVELTIVKRVLKLTDGNFDVSDVNGNIVFKVRDDLITLAGNPLITHKQKIFSAHGTWQAYRGKSTRKKDFLFTVKRSSMLQFKTTLNVFLAGNKSKDVCDFKIKGRWFKGSCKIYLGKSNTIIAQMHNKHSARSVILGKDTYVITVSPNVDYALIVSLIVIFNEINNEEIKVDNMNDG